MHSRVRFYRLVFISGSQSHTGIHELRVYRQRAPPRHLPLHPSTVERMLSLKPVEGVVVPLGDGEAARVVGRSARSASRMLQTPPPSVSDQSQPFDELKIPTGGCHEHAVRASHPQGDLLWPRLRAVLSQHELPDEGGVVVVAIIGEGLGSMVHFQRRRHSLPWCALPFFIPILLLYLSCCV